MDDKFLLKNIIAGDHDAFRILVERYNEAFFVFAMRILNDRFAAEDIVQDTFEVIWNGQKKLKEDFQIKSYMYGIIRNKCMVALRSSKISEKYRNNQKTLEDDIMAKYIETETMRLLTSAIEALPPRSAQVIKFSLEGLSQEEIAGQMGIAIATVKALKATGIKKLRLIFQHQDNQVEAQIMALYFFILLTL